MVVWSNPTRNDFYFHYAYVKMIVIYFKSFYCCLQLASTYSVRVTFFGHNLKGSNRFHVYLLTYNIPYTVVGVLMKHFHTKCYVPRYSGITYRLKTQSQRNRRYVLHPTKHGR